MLFNVAVLLMFFRNDKTAYECVQFFHVGS